MLEAGFKENRIMDAVYSFNDEHGKVKAITGTHVDDLLWACDTDVDHMRDHV